MCQPNDELSCDGALFGSFEVGSYRIAQPSRTSKIGPTHGLTVAFLKQQEKQFQPVRHSEFALDLPGIDRNEELMVEASLGRHFRLSACGKLPRYS
jgi:hypothetical protein